MSPEPESLAIADWGPLVLSTDIDDVLLEKLEEWLPTYLVHVGQSHGFTGENKLHRPRTFTSILTEDEMTDVACPAVLVTTADTASVVGGQNFTYRATWKVRVSGVVRGRTPRETRKNAAVYEGAIRAMLLHKGRTDNGPINDIDWTGAKPIAVSPSQSKDGRYLAAGTSTYNVSTDYAVKGFGGPNIPDEEAYLALAKVTDVAVDIEAQEEQE